MWYVLGPSTPIFFILSPGVNPLKEVEALGKKLGFTRLSNSTFFEKKPFSSFDKDHFSHSANKNFHNVSLGQGQEVVAEEAMSIAAKS